MLRRFPPALGAVLVLAGGAFAGCGSDAAPAKAAPLTRHSATTSAPPTKPGAIPKVKTPKPKDALAPTRIEPVKRDGKTPHPTVSALPATMTGVVRYGDGVRLKITGIRHGRVTGEGPGVIQEPTTTFALSLTNGEGRPLHLNSVVVTAVYGDPERIANPVYVSNTQDFAGTVRAGSTSKARYAFAIPVTRRSHVSIHVDFDAVHTAAVFFGSAG